jgi:hypothetical protein
MTLEVNKKTVFSEFEWVIRILDSAETKSHMDIVQNCFSLWEKKHTFKTLNSEETNFIKNLKLRFWVIFKNKNFSIERNSYFYK